MTGLFVVVIFLLGLSRYFGVGHVVPIAVVAPIAFRVVVLLPLPVVIVEADLVDVVVPDAVLVEVALLAVLVVPMAVVAISTVPAGIKINVLAVYLFFKIKLINLTPRK